MSKSLSQIFGWRSSKDYIGLQGGRGGGGLGCPKKDYAILNGPLFVAIIWCIMYYNVWYNFQNSTSIFSTWWALIKDQMQFLKFQPKVKFILFATNITGTAHISHNKQGWLVLLWALFRNEYLWGFCGCILGKFFEINILEAATSQYKALFARTCPSVSVRF